ncbi:MAG: hypothetical protein ACI3W9_07525 [Eubacteriales bacterium]
MKKNDYADSGIEKLSDEELSRRVGRYEIIERIGGVLVAALIIGGAILGLLLDDSSGVLLLLFLLVCACAIMVMVPMRAENKKNALLIQQLGAYFYGELARLFGPEPENPELPINEAFLRSTDPVRNFWKDCRITDFHEGVRNGVRFSAANVFLSRKEDSNNSEDSSTYTVCTFYGIVLRCKDICDPSLNIALRDRSSFRIPVRLSGSLQDPDKLRSCYPARSIGGLNDPDTFREYYSAHTWDGQAADGLVTQQMRELIGKLETFVGDGRVAALTFRDGELTLAMHTSYAFSHIPEKQDLKDIDGVRKRFTESLTVMGGLIDLLRDSCRQI